MGNRRWWTGCTVLCALGSACAPSGDGAVAVEGAAYEIRDSAGITIVENRRPQWGEGEGWWVEETPEVVIGGATDDPEQQLYAVRGLVLLSDGRIVLANVGTSELRWYSPQGELEASRGGSGSGPGEFLLLSGLVAAGGDSVAAGDLRNARLSIYGPDTELVRTVPLRGARAAVPAARFEDGSFLLRQSGFGLGGAGPVRVERERQPVYLAQGETVRLLDSIPFREVVVAPNGRTDPSGRPVIQNGARAFGASAWVIADREGWIVADNARNELQHRSPTGEVERLVRWEAPRRPVLDADVEGEIDARFAFIEDQDDRRRLRQAMEAHPEPPDSMPAFGPRQFIDPHGNVWVKTYVPSAEEDPNDYMVFDADGVWLGTVRVPPGIDVQIVGDDGVVGVVRDALDVETVVVHRLIREGR
jgi:hypothetical protein